MIKGDKKHMQGARPGFGIFLVTYVGALIYFLDKADGFGSSLLAFLQAAVWPAYVVNHVLTLMHA
jgi:hypothetical protein